MTFANEQRQKIMRVERLTRAAARAFGIAPAELLGDGKTRTLARTRQAVAYVARKEWGYSFPVIAAGLHRADHTTIMHAVGVVEARLDKLGPTVESIERVVNLARNLRLYTPLDEVAA